MQILRCSALALIFLTFGPALAQRQTIPAKVVSAGPTQDSVGFVSISGSNTVSAQIGRWDTPYPYPGTGEYAPGLQPTGYSSLAIDIDVNDGGLVSFRYLMQTYDTGIWDWYDILLETPTGTIPIIERLGKPGSDYGTYWISPSIGVSQSLNKWRNQRVRFIFRVMQDGWGDQTQGQVINFAISTCEVPPLTPVTDPTALNFENVSPINTTNLTSQAQAGLDCMRRNTNSAGGNFTLTSAYRPATYQQHLREVWDTWMAIRNRTNLECDELKKEIQTEFQRHGLLVRQRPAAGNPNAPHARGVSFDATITNLPSNSSVDAIAAACSMHRPWPDNDPVHYQPR